MYKTAKELKLHSLAVLFINLRSRSAANSSLNFFPLGEQALLDVQTEPTLSPHSSAPGGMSVHGCTVALGGGAEWCKRKEASQF